MSEFIKNLQTDRQKFLDGLAANPDINLDIFEDFYPDQAHFVFELLQNAEDAEAETVIFNLSPKGLSFEHDGARLFNEKDVRSITGIHDSTKKDEHDQIGKFGIGFKSVYVYTAHPTIYSGDFSFEIRDMVMPKPVKPDLTLGARTRIWLPFDNPKMFSITAHTEIHESLDNLSEKTLLFLQSIRKIEWQVNGGPLSSVTRKHLKEHLVELNKLARNGSQIVSYFLKFDSPVPDLPRQVVSVAFELELAKSNPYSAVIPVGDQFKIVPAKLGEVSVFFPADKETSNLKFHLHAPFMPELSRASIKQSAINDPLYEQLAELTSLSLEKIRDLGLLRSSFLEVLPIEQDNLPSPYNIFRTAIIESMREKPLTPTHDGSHSPAKNLFQARAAFKKLISKDDLRTIKDTDDPLDWVIGVTQQNNRLDRFLGELDIEAWDLREFLHVLRWSLTDDDDGEEQKNMRLVPWLNEKGYRWLQGFYRYCHQQLASRRSVDLHLLYDQNIVPTGDGRWLTGNEVFFPGPNADNAEFPTVHPDIMEFGEGSEVEEDVIALLQKIGVKPINEVALIKLLLDKKYQTRNEHLDLADLKKFMELVETEKALALLPDYRIFLGADGRMWKPSEVYLDEPFEKTGLNFFNSHSRAINDKYLELNINQSDFVSFCKALKVKRKLSIERRSVANHPEVHSLMRDWYGYRVKRSSKEVSQDFWIPGLDKVLQKPSNDLSLVIWETMCRNPFDKYLFAQYRPNASYRIQKQPSSLVLILRQSEWVPQRNGSFVRPKNAIRDDLPDGFAYDTGWKWLEAIEFGEVAKEKSAENRKRQTEARNLGFDDDQALKDAQWFAGLDPEARKQIHEDHESKYTIDFPQNDSRNPERRRSKVKEDAANAPDKVSETRERAVSVNDQKVKDQARKYLRHQYTNEDGVTFCQACDQPLPFEIDGKGFFEAVEFLELEGGKQHYQNYLALCPNHAAMYTYASEPKKTLARRFTAIPHDEVEFSVTLAEQAVVLKFTNTHLIDLEQVIAVSQNGTAQLNED